MGHPKYILKLKKCLLKVSPLGLSPGAVHTTCPSDATGYMDCSMWIMDDVKFHVKQIYSDRRSKCLATILNYQIAQDSIVTWLR